MRRVCDGDGVRDNRLIRPPDGWPGMAGALVACALGATLAINVGLDAVTSLVVALVVAIAASVAIRIGRATRIARLVTAIADGDLEPEAAPGDIVARLTSRSHRGTLARGLRRIVDEARHTSRAPLAAPPIVRLHPETCERLLHLAEVLESEEEVEPRGVAIVEDLITEPSSPLFGASEDAVEMEVRRALFILGAD